VNNYIVVFTTMMKSGGLDWFWMLILTSRMLR